MFDFLGGWVDGIYKLFWLVIVIYLLISGGIGYLLRLVSKPLKIDFTNRFIKNLDSDLLDLQLLRIYHGINVLNKKDARLISKAISTGALSEKDFRFLSFAPPIGKFKQGKTEIALYAAIAILFFAALIMVGNSAKTYKYGYAPYSIGSERALISEIYVYDPIKNEHLNAKHCKELTKSQSSGILAFACGYLLTNNPDEKKS